MEAKENNQSTHSTEGSSIIVQQKTKQDDPAARKKKGMNGGEKLWTALFAFGVPYSLLMFIFTHRQKVELDKRDIPQMHYSDFSLMLLFASILYFVKNIWERVTYSIFEPLIDKKHQDIERVYRTKRTSKWVFDFFYYGSFALWGFNIFHDILPSLMGGQQSCSTIWNSYPYAIDKFWFREYYLLQLGGQLYKSLDQIFKKRNDSKFWEYLLHHFLALVLQVHSYVAHVLLPGIVTLVAFDITDIFLASLRAQEAFGFKVKIIFPLYYFVTLGVWIYLRAIFYPVCVLAGGWTDHLFGDIYPPRNRLSDLFFPLLLTFLGVMNIYWTYALVMVGLKSIKSRTYNNVYDPTILKLKLVKEGESLNRNLQG